MILINGNWEEVQDLYDVSIIIRRQFNEDLANELDKLIPNHTNEQYCDLLCKLEEKTEEVYELEDELSYAHGEIDMKNREIEYLEKKINELEGDVYL